MTENSQKLYNLMVSKGYPESFALLVASEMHSDFTSKRMTGYIAARELLPLEEVADEMLAILSERDKYVDKRLSQNAQMAINQMYREDELD